MGAYLVGFFWGLSGLRRGVGQALGRLQRCFGEISAKLIQEFESRSGREVCTGRDTSADLDHVVHACVARLVGFQELKTNVKAQGSIKKEYDELRSRGVWNEKRVRKRSEVAEEAKRLGKEVHY